jgi:hypothetical protein
MIHVRAQMERRGKFCLVLGVVAALAAAAAAPSSANETLRVWLRGFDGRGQAFDLANVRGKLVALTFCSRFTKDEAAKVHGALTQSGDVMVVSVVDFAGVPSFAHGYARRKIAEHDLTGRLVHLVDEQGGLKRAFQTDPERRVDIFVIDRDGALRGRFLGEKQVNDAIRLIQQLRVSSASL